MTTHTPMPSHRPSEGVAVPAVVPATVFRIFGDTVRTYERTVYDTKVDNKLADWQAKGWTAVRLGATMLPLPSKRKPDPERKAAQTESITPVKKEPEYTKAVICVSTGKYYASQQLACSGEGVTKTNISACLSGRTKAAGGKRFRYATQDEKIAGKLIGA